VEARVHSSGLIYDVGLHTGGDTAYYLHQGYRVIAVEADPALAARAQKRFADAVAAGQLIILNVAIAESSGHATFWISDANSQWNSCHRRIAGRRGSSHHAIQAQTRRFEEILDEYGVPWYLKIDIEGNDPLCVRWRAAGCPPSSRSRRNVWAKKSG
jgi:FkbM family methyltransferase